MSRRTLFRTLAAIACAAMPVLASAQAWPERPIKFLMTAPAGSSIDMVGRTIAEKLGPRLGQPVVVENKPAASGTVAVGEAARAAPDGYTMVLGYPGPVAFAPLLQKLPYDVPKDLAPVIITTNQPNVLVVNSQLPVKTLGELIAYAKANPGKLNYASVGNGSSSHLVMEYLKAAAGFDATHVPFNGSPPAVTATIQNETQMMFAVMAPLQAQIQAGKLRPIAVTTVKRFPLFPDLPTIAESGFPGFDAQAWNGILVPAATPKPIVARLNAEINAIFKLPDVIEKMRAAGFELVGGTPEDFSALLARENAQWAPVMKRLGLKID
jgi:tripartite-type tricarboxylate transporter receptor subunit TctC